MPRANRIIHHQLLKDRLRKKVAAKHGEKKICLTMIVKNESSNMPRLLNSLLNKRTGKYIIDMISIVDTGSTDDTEEVIKTWGYEHNIPTTIHHEPFKNFSHNRTHSIVKARQAYPNADYFLLSDADFVWEVSNFSKVLLTDHKYLIQQYNKSQDYWNIRLLSSKVKWECVGVTHEYWTESKKQEYNGEIRTSRITTLRILDLEDGGAKNDKFERDERLLRAGLEDQNDVYLHTRYKFYLAQTLRDMNRYEEAIVWYNKRVQDKGWSEEVYYAKFQGGFNHEQLGWKIRQCIVLLGKAEKEKQDIELLQRWNPNNLTPSELMVESSKHFTDAAVNYMAAYNYRKTRAESLYYLTQMYRKLGLNELAYDLAVIGNTIKYPSNDTLFVERGCYDYLFDLEISIVAYYIEGKKEEGKKAAIRLEMKRDRLPPWVGDILDKNTNYYL